MNAAEQIEAPPIIRFDIPSDRNAVLSSWLRSYERQHPSEISNIDRPLYYDEHDAQIQRILTRDETLLLVVPSPVGEEHICSWLCGEIRPQELIVHWGSTFGFARGRGFFRALLDRFLAERGARQLVFTHRTRASKRVAAAVGATFNPYRIFT